MASRRRLATSLDDAFRNPVGARSGGASALFEGSAGAADHFRRIPLERIRPRVDGPRRHIDAEQLDELAASIRTHGVLQPIRLRPCGAGEYEVVAGERRRQAAVRAGLRHIPAVITSADEDKAYVQSLVENVQREDLNAVDRAHALRRLRVNLGLRSWEEVGRVVGLTRQHVHNLLRVADLPEPMQEDIRAGDLTEKHSRALLRLREHPHEQAELWERIHRDSLSGDSAIAESKRVYSGAARAAPSSACDDDVDDDDAYPAIPAAAVPTHAGRRIGAAVDTLLQVLAQATVDEVAAARGELTELGDMIATLLAAAPDAVDAASPRPDERIPDSSWRPMLMPVVGRQGS